MKYAHEVIDLLAAHPGRSFRMAQIVRHVAPGADLESLSRVRRGVQRVMRSLEEHDQVGIIPAAEQGGFALYFWKVRHQVVENCDRNHDNSGRTVASRVFVASP